MIKNILGRIFATWALIVFVITLLIFVFPIWATGFWKDPVGTAIFQQVSKFWMRIFFFATGIRLRLSGKQHFKKGENYVVVCNHNSFMDVPLTTPFIPGPNKTIAKVEMSRIPLFGLIYKRGSVLVDRKNEASRKQSFVDMKQALAKGLHMCIYPEGTRNKTRAPLQPFHTGAFRLSVDSGKAILPAVIFNTAKVLPIDKTFFFWPVRVRMDFLEPVYPDGLTSEELREKVYALMRDYYLAHKDQ